MFWLRNDEYDDDDTDFKVYFYDFYIVTERGAAALLGMPNWQSDLSWIMVIGEMEISFALVWASFVSSSKINAFYPIKHLTMGQGNYYHIRDCCD